MRNLLPCYVIASIFQKGLVPTPAWNQKTLSPETQINKAAEPELPKSQKVTLLAAMSINIPGVST